MNQGTFLLRGLEKVRDEFSLTALAYNTIELVPVDGPMRAELRDALARSDLPHADIDEPGRQFFAACVDERTVGFVGLEIHGAGVLVRSLVLLERESRKGFGSTLLRSALEIAAAQGVERAWALTMTAQSLLENVGTDRENRRAAVDSAHAGIYRSLPGVSGLHDAGNLIDPTRVGSLAFLP
jgi:N-acetylglutamate synthase-like GNAT family acetyltransferase